MERKEKERERRLQMKELCMKLSSLVPRHRPEPSSNVNIDVASSNYKDMLTQHDNLDEAVAYIIELKQRVENLKQIRDSKIAVMRNASAGRSNPTSSNAAVPVIKVHSEDANLEVILVSAMHNQFELHRVIRILEEEGADVKSANISVVGDKVFYTIHSQALSSRIGFEASRVLERLRDFVS